MTPKSLSFVSKYDTVEILAECDEFVLQKLGDGTVSARPIGDVFIAHAKAALGTNDAGEETEEDAARMFRAIALGEIYLSYQRVKRGEESFVEVTELVAKVFGPLIEEALAKDDETGIADLQRKLSQAALHLMRLWKGQSTPPKGRTKDTYRIFNAIEIARKHFEKNSERPGKAYIRHELEKVGAGYHGRNRNKEWERLWRVTGLHNLPESH
jgi:hypothetical protein